MWTFDDASTIGASDMDRRACPSYEAGFDARDPLGSVLEWSERGPARVLRRRCRSEGVDRSPYEDGSMHTLPHHNRTVPNKSHFTLNTALETPFEKYRNECSLSASEIGDYIMAYDHIKHQSYQPGRSKLRKTSPTRSILFSAQSITRVEDGRLPKVEELFEKPDHDLMDVPITKQPLKSILNNPIPKSPQGILKKPKNRTYNLESKEAVRSSDGRRRQRAASESDNLYQSLNMSPPLPGYDRLASNMKRAKDNAGGYSYGTAIASLGSTHVKSPNSISRHLKNSHLLHQPAVCNKVGSQSPVNILRTTAINETPNGVTVIVVPREETPTPTCPTVSPALPVSSETTIPVAKKATKIVKKKPKSSKVKKMKSKVECGSAEIEAEDAGLSSPSPEPTEINWTMDTDTLIAEVEKLEKVSLPVVKQAASPVKQALSPVKSAPPVKPPPSPITKKDEVMERVATLRPGKSLGTTTVKKVASQDIQVSWPESLSNCLRHSLFPRVPPYLKFINHDECPSLKIPLPIQKHLKWKLTNITPIVVKKTLTNSGFRLVKSECDTSECPQEETIDWVGIWGKHMKSIMFRAIKDGQKMNHFPGTFQIGRKDRLWRNLQKLATKHGVKEFGIMPKTYVLPHDLKLLKHDWEKYAENNEKWIIKPPASARGTGIKVVSRWTQIPKKRSVVVQRYISKPYLINGSKFDMRLYVLVTSVHPLRIYLYKDGLARFASVKYTNEITSLNDRYMHLTNYSINRLSKNYTPNEDFTACEGHKWTLQTLFQYLKTERHVDTAALWDSMKDLVIKTIISGEASISSLTKANVTSRYNCYELFGIDVLLDEDLKPWLLEVNISPSLHSASPLDIHVKGPLVTTVLNIAQYQVPTKTNLDMLTREKPHKLMGLPYDSRLYTIYLSKEERDKHIIYTNMEDRDLYLRDILSTLTSDDVRHLIQAEDELTQSGDMERVFPSSNTYTYLGFIAGPRYYNRLFDAWESRYNTNREAGIQLLRNLCDIGYHLEVPPVPLKRQLHMRGRPLARLSPSTHVGTPRSLFSSPLLARMRKHAKNKRLRLHSYTNFTSSVGGEREQACNDVDVPSPPASERPSVHSIPSLEPSHSTGSMSPSAHTCSEVLSQSTVAPQVVEPARA